MPEKETGRLEAFSDGVFAIAITLLALELKVPHFEAGQITGAAVISGLAHQWPSYLAFITSFFTVLIMWVHHHAIFRLVKRVDVTLLFANGFLLMLVTVVPFPTALVADILEPPPQQPPAPSTPACSCSSVLDFGCSCGPRSARRF